MQATTAAKRQSVFTIVRMLHRRKLYLIIPAILITAAVAVYSKRLPVRYRAQALVASQRAVPQPYLGVRTESMNLNVQEHLRAIRETLLSPAVLQTVIREFKLYPMNDAAEIEDATEAMKSRIKIQVEGPDAFYVGFESGQPQEVAQVANRLAALFVERTTVLRGQRVAQVDSVLDAEVERLRKQLREQEEGLKDYRQSMAQALPDRVASNLKRLE